MRWWLVVMSPDAKSRPCLANDEDVSNYLYRIHGNELEGSLMGPP